MKPHEVCQLGDEACVLLTQVIKRCNDWQCVLAALQEIPLDVSAQSAELAAQRHLAEQLKAILFPNHP